MYIIDLGHKVCGNNYMHSEWIKVLPHTPPSEDDDQNVVSVRFKFKEAVFVLHCFQKKSKSGIATPKKDMDIVHARRKVAETLAKEIRDGKAHD